MLQIELKTIRIGNLEQQLQNHKMSKKVADQIVEMLVANNVKRVYAVTGDSLNEFNDAIRREGSIQWIHVRHEEAGAYAAAAEAELEGFAVCAGSSGPGHIHLINGLYEAHKSGVPVLAIASTIHTGEFGVDYFQGTNTTKLFADCSNYNEIATTPAQVPRMLQSAIQHALSLKGVAVLGLPGDVAAMDAVENVTTMQNFYTKVESRAPHSSIQELADELNAAKKSHHFLRIGRHRGKATGCRLIAVASCACWIFFPRENGNSAQQPERGRNDGFAWRSLCVSRDARG